MRRVHIILIVVAFFISAFVWDSFNEASLNPFDYARITEVDYKAVLVDEPGSNGKVIITERLTFEIHAASKSNLFWELWRDLPEEYIDGVKVEYQVNYVKQLFDDKPDVEYMESYKLYWDDYDYINTVAGLGPGKWYHSKGPYDNYYNFECLLFYVDGLYRETVVFEIEYEMYNAALRYNDCSELYLSLYSENTINYLKSLKGQILIPDDKMPSAQFYYAYTLGTDFNTFDFSESTNFNPGYHTFLFKLDEKQLRFKPYNEYVEFVLVAYGEDRHKFTEHASYNDYYNDDVLLELKQEQAKYEGLPSVFKQVKTVAVFVLSFLSVIVGYFVLKIDKKIKKKHIFYTPEMEMEYFRDIPSDLDPNFAATLVFCKHKLSEKIEDGYSSIMLSLVRKGYVELEKINERSDWKPANVRIVIKDNSLQQAESDNTDATENKEEILSVAQDDVLFDDRNRLSITETLYLSLIQRHSKTSNISVKGFQERITQDYEYTETFVNSIKSAIIAIGTTQGYFQKADFKQPRKNLHNRAITYGIIGGILLTLGNYLSYQTRLDLAFGGFFIFGITFVISAFYIEKQSKKYVLLSQFGENEYAKWRGLYNFLNSETLMNERTIIELGIWEQYLVYATAFGISEKVINAINVRCKDIESSPVLRNPYYRSRIFYNSGTSFKTATRTASYTARSGGHGGYGGGGRGGGGGGGGH